MRRLAILRSRQSVVVILGLMAAALTSLTTALAAPSSSRATRAQVNVQCPEGTIRAEGPLADGGSGLGVHRACVPMGEPETFSDLARSSAELSARETAPFASTAQGAYLHAVGQRNAMLAAGG